MFIFESLYLCSFPLKYGTIGMQIISSQLILYLLVNFHLHENFNTKLKMIIEVKLSIIFNN